MVSALVDTSADLITFRHAVLHVLHPEEHSDHDVYDAMQETLGKAHQTYLHFLYVASDAIGIDHLRNA